MMLTEKQDIYNAVMYEYENYSYTGKKVFKDQALKYYNEYKLKGGKKIIKGLEV